MDLHALLDQAKQPARPQYLRNIARNIELDCADLPCAHSDAKHCGNHVGKGALSRLHSDYLVEASPAEPDEFHDELQQRLGDACKDLHKQRTPHTGKTDGKTVRVHRYIDLSTIHRHWLEQSGTEDAKAIRHSVDRLHAALQRIADKKEAWRCAVPSLTALHLSRNEPRAVVWITRDDEPPHRKAPYANAAHPANALARDLALPNCETPEARRACVGLAALSYDIDADLLFKPTVAQAGIHAAFFPGYTDEKHGRTEPLDDHMQPPWTRDRERPGLAEWVHDNRPIRVVWPDLEPVGEFV